MNSTIVRRAFSLALCAGALASLGCERDTPRTDTSALNPAAPAGKVGTTPMTDKTTANNEQAITAIAASRCERETRCNNVGAGKKWASAETCRSDLMTKNRDELSASECPGGIVQKELQECLGEIQNENCNNPLDKLGRLAACRSSDLCKSTGL
ncbi:MAG TPA: DUF6184 family natural product biosynthesis lipoprotein [Polyangiaceae bacterium]|nr:DUF6184 family natural product biosynthesis lipoprotein [Polyangiaceae bacterium]